MQLSRSESVVSATQSEGNGDQDIRTRRVRNFKDRLVADGRTPDEKLLSTYYLSTWLSTGVQLPRYEHQSWSTINNGNPTALWSEELIQKMVPCYESTTALNNVGSREQFTDKNQWFKCAAETCQKDEVF